MNGFRNREDKEELGLDTGGAIFVIVIMFLLYWVKLFLENAEGIF